jgi:flavorubredoxin
MATNMNLNIDYNRPVMIADGVWWVGSVDDNAKLHCNPYIVVDGDEAVLIDGGSRPEFSTVMMKILQAGIVPDRIVALIYQHYDPDLCGSLPDFEAIIDNPELKIISHHQNHAFINHYAAKSPLVSLNELNHQYRFCSGRTLKFINTPYCHCHGSFVTLDSKTGVLFSSDLFGSYSEEWELFLDLNPECETCESFKKCPHGYKYCPFPDIIDFHRIVMTSNKALRYTMDLIERESIQIIASQHGSVISDEGIIRNVSKRLVNMDTVGIDGIIGSS